MTWVRFHKTKELLAYGRQNYAFWTDGDTQDIPKEEAKRLIKEFPENFEILGQKQITTFYEEKEIDEITVEQVLFSHTKEAIRKIKKITDKNTLVSILNKDDREAIQVAIKRQLRKLINRKMPK